MSDLKGNIKHTSHLITWSQLNEAYSLGMIQFLQLTQQQNMFHIAVFQLKAKKLLIFQGSEIQIEIWKESLCLMYILF